MFVEGAPTLSFSFCFPHSSLLFPIYLPCFDCIIMVLTKAACRSLLTAARAHRMVLQRDSRVPYKGRRVQRSFSSEPPRPSRTYALPPCSALLLHEDLLYPVLKCEGRTSFIYERLRAFQHFVPNWNLGPTSPRISTTWSLSWLLFSLASRC